MNKDSVKKSKQFLIFSILTIIGLIVILVLFVIKPIVQAVYQTKDVFEEGKIKLETIKKDAAQSHVFVDLVKNLGKDQRLVEDALIKKDSVVIFIQDIEKIAKEVGNTVDISQLAAKKAAKAPSNETKEAEAARLAKLEAEKKKIRLSLEIKGNYRNFLEFLYKLENMTYVFQLESVEMKNAADRYGTSLRATEEVPIDFMIGRIVLSFTPKNNGKEKK